MLISVWNTRFQRETSRSFLYQGRNKHAIFFVGDTSRLLCYFQHFMILKYYTDMGNLLFCRGTLADRYVLFHLLCYMFSFTQNMSSPIMNELSFTKLCVHTKRSAKIVLGSSTLLPYDVTDFAVLPAWRLWAGNSLFFWISCDLEVTSKSSRCWKNICVK